MKGKEPKRLNTLHDSVTTRNASRRLIRLSVFLPT